MRDVLHELKSSHFVYPPGEANGVELRAGDIGRLRSGVFMNDALLDLGNTFIWSMSIHAMSIHALSINTHEDPVAFVS